MTEFMEKDAQKEQKREPDPHDRPLDPALPVIHQAKPRQDDEKCDVDFHVNSRHPGNFIGPSHKIWFSVAAIWHYHTHLSPDCRNGRSNR